jgi:hypothetical protein
MLATTPITIARLVGAVGAGPAVVLVLVLLLPVAAATVV